MMVSNLDKAIEKNEKYLQALRMVKEVSEIEARNVYDIAFQKYITLEGTAPAANFLNDNGYRTQGVRGERKYISTDITKMIEDESIHEKVNPKILFLALGLKNSRAYSNRMDKLIKISNKYYQAFAG